MTGLWKNLYYPCKEKKRLTNKLSWKISTVCSLIVQDEKYLWGSVRKRIKIIECKLNNKPIILKELQIIVAVACVVVCLSR